MTAVLVPASASPQPALGQARRTRRGAGAPSRWWVSVLVLLGAGVLWQIAARTAQSVYFPPITDVLQRIREDWLSGPATHLFVSDDLKDLVVASMGRLLPGFVFGALLGSSLGFAIGLLPRFRAMCYPVIHFLRAVPAVAMLPLFVVLLGLGNASIFWLIATSVTWPILLNVVAGAESVEPQMRETLRLYGASPAQRVRWLVLPAATPQLFAALRIATTVALAVMTVSEMYMSSDGIGRYILYSQRQYDNVAMWAGVLLLAVVGLTLNGALSLAEHRLLAWHRGARAGTR